MFKKAFKNSVSDQMLAWLLFQKYLNVITAKVISFYTSGTTVKNGQISPRICLN